MFLVKKPKVSSFVLTESYFDGATPLTIRFKLNSKICTDFLQVFVEKESSEAILGTHYEIQPAAGLSVLRDPLTKDLKSLSFLVEGSKGFFDLYLDPLINLDIKKDFVLNLRIKKSDGYIVEKSDVQVFFKSSRKIFIGDSFFVGGLKPRTLTEKLDLGTVYNIEHPIKYESEVSISNVYLQTQDIITEYGSFVSYGGEAVGVDTEVPTIQFTQSLYEVNESAGSYVPVATISRTGGNLGSSSSARLFIRGGTAKMYEDYILKSPVNIVFPAGSESVDIIMSIINRSGLIENDESILLEIVPLEYAFAGTQTQTTIIIKDNV